jgi:hypothetical protein
MFRGERYGEMVRGERYGETFRGERYGEMFRGERYGEMFRGERYRAGADPGFQVGGGALKKIAPSGGGAKIFGVFRVKNYDFTPKNYIFSNCGGRRENFWGISCEKSRFYAKKSYFFQF